MDVAAASRFSVVSSEFRKLAAFVRRDLLEMLSYRLALVSDWLSMIGQVVVFYFVGRMVSPDTIAAYGGSRVSYIEYVSVGPIGWSLRSQPKSAR